MISEASTKFYVKAGFRGYRFATLRGVSSQLISLYPQRITERPFLRLLCYTSNTACVWATSIACLGVSLVYRFGIDFSA